MKLTGLHRPKWTKSPQNSGFSEETAVLGEILAPVWFLLPQVYYFTRWIFPSDWIANLEKNFSSPMWDERGQPVHNFLNGEEQ